MLDDPTQLAAAGGLLVIVIAIILKFLLGGEKTPFLKQRPRDEVVKVPLIARVNLSPDTVKFTFGLPTPDTVLGLPVGACIKFYAPNVTGVKAGEWNGREDPEKDDALIERKYTPTSSDRQKGSFDMVIKVYEAGVIMPQFPDGGKMSQFMGRLKVGDGMGISGPWGQIEYTAPGTFVHMKKTLKKTKIGMLAGGTGITPMLQILTAIFENSADATSCSLVYANKTEADILVRDMLEALVAKFPQRLTVHYTLDSPPAQWEYSKGFITADMIAQVLPPPSADTVVLMCGPPPMVKFACKANLDTLGYNKADQLCF